MKHLPARVPEDRARKIAAQGLWWNLFRLAESFIPSFKPALSVAKPLPHIELVWMPYYVIDVGLEGPHGADSIRISVDGYEGQFSVYPFESDARDGDVEGAAFVPALTPEEALRFATAGALNWLLLNQRKRRMTPGAMRVIELLRYPFWVYYYQRRRGLLDLRIVDAVTGERTGSKTKTAIVRAFQHFAETEGKGNVS